MRSLLAGVGLVAWLPAGLWAQGYRLRLDTRVQSVTFRGVALDSIAASDAAVDGAGGFATPDGFAVQCRPGFEFCTYYRPGTERQAGPVVTTADVSVWGIGVPGLRFRSTARIGVDLGDNGAWPRTDPAVRLLEAYAEYVASPVTVQLGRTHSLTRFGFVGFDGAKAELRVLGRRLDVTAYGGWGLARGVALPVNSPALNPLDDFQSTKRQLLGGASLGWSTAIVRARVMYQREVDPSSDRFVSERAGVEASIRAPLGFRAVGGADYDIAAGWWGSAEGALTYMVPRGLGSVSVGVRRYRPHFDFWTIWGAFSPVPYRAVFAMATVSPLPGLQLRVGGEGYEFNDAEEDSPVVDVKNDGWRWSATGTYARASRWSASAGMRAELGPGASSVGYEGRVTVSVTECLDVSAQGSLLERPLEFRSDDARLWTYGVYAGYRPFPTLRLTLDVHRYDETRRRPDAAQFDWNQLRVNLGATVFLGSSVDESSLPSAILRIPERQRAR